VEHLFKWGAIHKVHNGVRTSFWHDIWVGDAPLRVQFPALFNMCRNPDATVDSCYFEGEWEVELRRSLSPREVSDWSNLMRILQPIQLSSQGDEVEWALDKSMSFST